MYHYHNNSFLARKFKFTILLFLWKLNSLTKFGIFWQCRGVSVKGNFIHFMVCEWRGKERIVCTIKRWRDSSEDNSWVWLNYRLKWRARLANWKEENDNWSNFSSFEFYFKLRTVRNCAFYDSLSCHAEKHHLED